MGLWAILEVAKEKEIQACADMVDAENAHKGADAASADAQNKVAEWEMAFAELQAKQKLAIEKVRRIDVACAALERIVVNRYEEAGQQKDAETVDIGEPNRKAARR